LFEGLDKFLKESELYAHQITLDSVIKVGFQLSDTGENAALKLDKRISLVDEISDSDCLISMNSVTFQSILNGDSDFASLLARSNLSDSRPINFEILNNERSSDAFEAIKALMNFFFIPGLIKVKSLEKKFAGYAHGAHPIPLVYWGGLRYAWYHISAGEVLNIEGEKDHYPQAFIPLKGKGRIEVQDFSQDLEAEKIYYIPPNQIHKICAQSNIELIWIAWNTKD
jgi:hypothetical protein